MWKIIAVIQLWSLTLFVLMPKPTVWKYTKLLILPSVSCRYEHWSLALRDESKLRVLFVRKKVKVRGGWRNSISRSFTICTLHQKIVKIMKQNVQIGEHSLLRGKWQTYTLFWSQNPQGKRLFEKSTLEWENSITWLLKNGVWRRELDSVTHNRAHCRVRR